METEHDSENSREATLRSDVTPTKTHIGDDKHVI